MSAHIPPLLTLGTRGSPLALAQAHEVKRRLSEASPQLASPDAIAIVVIKTTGDSVQDRTLAEIGGKGLFTKEIDEAQLSGSIDLAIHSMKDVPTFLPPGLILDAILPREDPRDAFISTKARCLTELAAGSVVGTASLRRTAQVLLTRPDLRVVPLRGNVQTRLRRLEEGAFDATLLAMAGLHRLNLNEHATAPVDASLMLPAVGQGAIGIACRENDERCRAWLRLLDDIKTHTCVAAERAFLEILDGSCRTPIAALAEYQADGSLWLRTQIARPDGTRSLETERRGLPADAVSLGQDAAHELLNRAGPNFFEMS